jgi:pimeloyl-ACP methyl ester carboxylesterase
VAGALRRPPIGSLDERGCGLSDWDVDEASYTLDAWVADLETVVDTLEVVPGVVEFEVAVPRLTPAFR